MNLGEDAGAGEAAHESSRGRVGNLSTFSLDFAENLQCLYTTKSVSN